MPLKTFVKVGSITNLSEARYCAGMGVDMLGFRVIKGQGNYISPAKFQEIRGWITGPQVAAEIYGIQNQAELELVLTDYKPDYLEMGLDELELLGELPLPFILSCSAGASLMHLRQKPSLVLLKELMATTMPYPCLLEVNAFEEAQRSLGVANIAGIAMNGGPEISPGLKEYALAAILEQLEVD